MDALMSVLQKIGRYFLLIRFTDVIDIAIIAFLIYELITLAKNTRAWSILKGVAVLLVALLLSTVFHLQAINYLLSHILNWGVLALFILFQPEIRQILEHLGSSNEKLRKIFVSQEMQSAYEKAIKQTVQACKEMSESKTGALIVFERKRSLNEYVLSGTRLDAEVTSELLKNIFFVKAPMHDGAVIVRDGRVLSAGCMLPLSQNVNLSRDLGMRHRAGIGMSEHSDAVVVIVSEETGAISVAIGGLLKRHLMPETLDQMLINELIPETPEDEDDKKPSSLQELLSFLHLLKKEEHDGEE